MTVVTATKRPAARRPACREQADVRPWGLVPGAARADPDPGAERGPPALRDPAGLHRRAVRPDPGHAVDRRSELPGPAARHAVLGVVPDRPGVGGRRDRPAVPAGTRSRPAPRPGPQAALARPRPRHHPVGHARGRRRCDVAARLQPGRRCPQRDPPHLRPRRRPGLAQRPVHRTARRDRRGGLGRDAPDHGHPARRLSRTPRASSTRPPRWTARAPGAASAPSPGPP